MRLLLLLLRLFYSPTGLCLFVPAYTSFSQTDICAGVLPKEQSSWLKREGRRRRLALIERV